MRLQFVISEILNGLRRNLSMAVSVVLVTMISMYLMGLGLMGIRQVDTMKDYWYDKVEVTVLKCAQKTTKPACNDTQTTDEQRAAIKTALTDLPAVQTVYYESADQAYAAFTKAYANSPLSKAGKEYFADSYRVKLKDPTKFDVVASAITGMPGVASVQDQKKPLESFFNFMGKVSWAAIALAVLMVICAAMLISTTIRQIAYSRRRETSIMRLVGASNFTIRAPFVLEAMVETAFIGTSDVFAVAPWVLGGVTALSILTSWVALRRYLRV